MVARFMNREQMTLSIANQIQRMAELFPEFKYTWRKNRVEWVGEIHPTKISSTYKVRIRYGLKRYPLIWVIEPSLDTVFLADPTAHIYRKKLNLCLFYPKHNEWVPSIYIAESIVPWVYKWLFFYEGHLVTGEWKGSGIPHKPL